MDSAAMRPIRQGKPDRVNHDTPSPVADGVRDSFAQDIDRAVDVRIQAAPIAGAEQAALDAFANIDLLLDSRRMAGSGAGTPPMVAPAPTWEASNCPARH